MSNPANNSFKSALSIQVRLVRRSGRRLRQAARYGQGALNKAPVLFANSFPKSGTHLLTQVLAGFARIGTAVVSGLPAVVTFDGHSGRQRSQEEILTDLKRLLPGDIAYGHLHAQPETLSCLCREGVAAFFILRDPRDVVVSHAHYVTDMAPGHILHHYYVEQLGNLDKRIKASIRGVRKGELRVSNGKVAADGDGNLPDEVLPDIYRRFEPYLGWLGQPEVLVLHYERFITQPQVSLGKVFDHAAGRGYKTKLSRQAAVHTLANSINPQRSPTFRSGKIGGWRAAFSQEHIDIFKEVSGDLLVRLGYEQDSDW